MGDAGPVGDQGSQGPAGPSGFVTVLSFEAAPLVTVGPNLTTPGACQTAAYVADANEVAIVSLDVTTFTSAGTASLFLAPMMSQAGGGASFLVNNYAIGPITASVWGSLHSQATVNLNAGVSYRFVTGVRSDATLAMNTFVCRGIVQIAKRP